VSGSVKIDRRKGGTNCESGSTAIAHLLAKVCARHIQGNNRGSNAHGALDPELYFSLKRRCSALLWLYIYDTTMPDYPWPSNIPLTERNQAIIEAYQHGETLERIAATFEISIARVHQILKRRG
jgi:hypothetical protein